MDVDDVDFGMPSPKKGISSFESGLGNSLQRTIPEQPLPRSHPPAVSTAPLKQVKNKLSSILKSSKGLLASSAAISAEGKSSLLSPSMTRLGLHLGPSVESFKTAEYVLYPDLSQHRGFALASREPRPEQQHS